MYIIQLRKDVPVICFIGRLAPQKGVDLIEEIFPWYVCVCMCVCV
jgi:glycogen synthase